MQEDEIERKDLGLLLARAENRVARSKRLHENAYMELYASHFSGSGQVPGRGRGRGRGDHYKSGYLRRKRRGEVGSGTERQKKRTAGRIFRKRRKRRRRKGRGRRRTNRKSRRGRAGEGKLLRMMWWMLFAYLGLLPLLLVLLVCGDRPGFEGTWLERVHVFIFGGGCLDSLRNIMGAVCGQKWSDSCAAVEFYCCERPNPFLQLFYLGILGGTYVAIYTTSLQYLPGLYLSVWHRYAGQGAILVGFLLFLMTSFCDPGTISAASLPRQASIFPFDNILYEEKDCYTCKIPRPARSKHCSICNRCISRFDHHCGWMNNCIGENNLRYFLGFLIWHILLCWYGIYILGAILLGELTERRVIQAISFYYGPSKREIYPHILQWLLTFYSAQVLIMIFLLVVSLLLTTFAGYHLYLVAKNTTTNETYKWDDYQRWQAEVAWSKIQAEESQRAASGNSEDASKSAGKLGRFGFMFRGRKAHPKKPKPSSFKQNNLYNRGILANVAEVLYPLSQRTKARQTDSRSKQE